MTQSDAVATTYTRARAPTKCSRSVSDEICTKQRIYEMYCVASSLSSSYRALGEKPYKVGARRVSLCTMHSTFIYTYMKTTREVTNNPRRCMIIFGVSSNNNMLGMRAHLTHAHAQIKVYTYTRIYSTK